jgi:uncharacterized protein YeaO (DUF488 family)
MKMDVRIDCYIAKLDSFRISHPKAHFEIITRSWNSILAPSWELIERVKKEKLSFSEYRTFLIGEFRENTEKVRLELKRLKRIAMERILFLVCYEKDPNNCHRSIVKDLVEMVI